MFVNVKRVIIAAGLLGMLVLAGWFGGRPLYRDWRERRALNQAESFLAQGDFRNAAIAARQVLIRNQTNLAACRVMANLTETLHSPAALHWRQRVAEAQPGNLTNQMLLARTAILFGHYGGAAQALDAVPPAQREHPGYQQLTAMIALARRDYEDAGLRLTEAARLEPENKLTQLNLAVLQAQGTNQAQIAGARQALRDLSSLPEFRADALRQLTLLALREKDWTTALALAGELQASTNAPLDDALLHLRVLEESGSAQLTPRLHELEASAYTNAHLIGGLSVWLFTHGRTDEAARWLASLPDELQQRFEVRMARADGCLSRRDWAGLKELLEGKEWKDTEFLRHALLARVYREQNATMSSQADWLAATRLAAENPRALGLLARLAGSWQWPREREDALWTLVQRFPAERWALGALSDAFLKSGNTLGLQKFYEELVRRDPKDVVAGNNLAATSLLLHLQTDRAHDLARSVYQQRTNDATCASTYAYSLYLQGHGSEGIAVLKRLPAAALEQPSVALYLGVLQATNSAAEAKRYLDLAATGPLLPEERALLEAARLRR